MLNPWVIKEMDKPKRVEKRVQLEIPRPPPQDEVIKKDKSGGTVITIKIWDN